MHQVASQVHILDIAFARHTPPLLMRVGVVAYLMSTVQNHLIQIGVKFDILAQNKECCLGIVAVQGVEYPLRNTGRGPIVKGKIDTFAIVNTPYHLREDFAYQPTGVYPHIALLYC